MLVAQQPAGWSPDDSMATCAREDWLLAFRTPNRGEICLLCAEKFKSIRNFQALKSQAELLDFSNPSRQTRFLHFLKHDADFRVDNNLPGATLARKMARNFYKDDIHYMMEDKDRIFCKFFVDGAGIGLLTVTGVWLSNGDEHTREKHLFSPFWPQNHVLILLESWRNR